MQIKDQNSNKKSNYEFCKIKKKGERSKKRDNKQNSCGLMDGKMGLVLKVSRLL